MAKFREGKIEVKKLADLIPTPYNPREISKQAFKGLSASIDRFGLLTRIVWNQKTKHIISGNQRYKYLLDKGVTETEVVVVDLDNNEEIALNITLNNPHVRGRFTEEALKMLKTSEAQIGSAFSELKLDTLFKMLEQDMPKVKPKGSSSGSHEKQDDPVPKAIITCPNCKSQYEAESGRIVRNTVNAGGK